MYTKHYVVNSSELCALSLDLVLEVILETDSSETETFLAQSR